MRVMFRGLTCCFALLLIGNTALAYHVSCQRLSRESAAYYACEALNQQERFEHNRISAGRQQEEERKQEQIISHAKKVIEDLDRMEAREKQRKMATELNSVVSSMGAALRSTEAGECPQAQKSLDALRLRINKMRPSYQINGETLTRDEIEDYFVILKTHNYLMCLSKPERSDKVIKFLNYEASQGRKIAQELLPIVKGLFQEESKQIPQQNKMIPRFFDYGTDMASIHKYLADINETNLDACRDQWKRKDADADAAYCIARHDAVEIKVPMLREASKLGHPLAQNDLAMHLASNNIKKESEEISKLIRASANSGIPHAQVTVGWWHMTGEHSFKIDHTEAMKWNLMAYKQGHSEGANNIGELYEKGLGVSKNMEQAKSWYRKASVLGNIEATTRLAQISR